MTELEKRIYNEIARSNSGIKGSEIAQRLGMDKKNVNSMLASSAALKSLVIQDATYKWHTIINNDQKGSTTKANTPEPDEDLKRLCNYYLNCLSIESGSSVSQFLTSRYSLQYAPLNGLSINANKDEDALALLKRINSNRDAKAYLGYPVRIYSFYGKNNVKYQKIAPVFLFPIDYQGGEVSISWLPTINMEVLKGYVEGGTDSLTTELINLENALGMNEADAEIDADELVIRLYQIRQWDWMEPIDPYTIPTAECMEGFADGIYNRPIIIQAEKEKYTQGLETELMMLANMPESGYKDTALYAWVKAKPPQKDMRSTKPLLEVLPLNTEQSLAVETALASDLTIVTGPPGTGKSQVVTDLLVNTIWNNKSALFSSKNNKAVDVVDVRVNGLSKRPVLLRIGNNHYATRLAEIIEGLLGAKNLSTEQEDVRFYLNEYDRLNREVVSLKEKKNRFIDIRNELDEYEKKYCTVRYLTERFYWTFDEADQGKICKSAFEYKSAYNRALKENNSFFTRVFWKLAKKKKERERDYCAEGYNRLAQKYSLELAAWNTSKVEADAIYSSAEAFDNALMIMKMYKKALESFNSWESLESIDKKLADGKEKLADIAYKLWGKWLAAQTVSFTAEERREMSDYVAAMKLAGDIDLSEFPDLKQRYNSLMRKMTKYLQCWAVTSLSVRGRVPFQPGMFDYVIVDEASQCDIASMLPLLYRAKKAVIIGDPNQLNHISQVTKKQDLTLLHRNGINPSWSYSANSLYALAAGLVEASAIVQLKDHFRSCAGIIEFSNDVFYDGSLRTATDYSKLITPRNEKPGIRWIDVAGRTIRPSDGSAYNTEEVKTIINELKRLITAGYKGSIGVTTPFRRQAEQIRKTLEQNEKDLLEKLLLEHEFIADTVHKFQGDERDLMIFSTVVSEGAQSSSLGFLSSTGNLFNVAITRARAVLIVIGNKGYCKDCEVDYLKKFVAYYDRIRIKENDRDRPFNNVAGREYPWVSNPEQVSEWEKTFYTALFDAGVRTIPQYGVDRYKLDLAIILNNGKKLDIEVDGEMYHRSWNGELCYRDQLRNQRLFELGWDVLRFWVYQIRDEQDLCIERIKKWVAENTRE